jgi:hypothetical protein
VTVEVEMRLEEYSVEVEYSVVVVYSVLVV